MPLKDLPPDALPRKKMPAVLQLARRDLAQRPQECTVFAKPDAVKQFLQLKLAARQQKVFTSAKWCCAPSGIRPRSWCCRTITSAALCSPQESIKC